MRNDNSDWTPRSFASFAFHQFLSTYGIGFSAPYLVASVFDVIQLFGKQYSAHLLFFLLTGTPYFPIQIFLGLLVGYLLSRHFRHRVMVWVWIIPLVVLVYALAAVPTLTPSLTPTRYQAGVGESRFAHYFGWGCQPVNRCLDQVDITLPFYVAVSYSLGALIARKMPQRLRNASPRHSWVYLTVGIFFIVAFCSEVHQIFHLLSGGVQWQWFFLQPLTVVGGTGVVLILYSILVARTRRPKTSR